MGSKRFLEGRPNDLSRWLRGAYELGLLTSLDARESRRMPRWRVVDASPALTPIGRYIVVMHRGGIDTYLASGLQ